MQLKRLFPYLRASHFQITSRATAMYNCIAWSVGVNDCWWEPLKGYFWPSGDKGRHTKEVAIGALQMLGFVPCASSIREPGLQKVALYGDTDGYTHAARQLENGHWASKIGKLENIEHRHLEDLFGSDYGRVVQILSRQET